MGILKTIKNYFFYSREEFENMFKSVLFLIAVIFSFASLCYAVKLDKSDMFSFKLFLFISFLSWVGFIVLFIKKSNSRKSIDSYIRYYSIVNNLIYFLKSFMVFSLFIYIFFRIPIVNAKYNDSDIILILYTTFLLLLIFKITIKGTFPAKKILKTPFDSILKLLFSFLYINSNYLLYFSIIIGVLVCVFIFNQTIVISFIVILLILIVIISFSISGSYHKIFEKVNIQSVNLEPNEILSSKLYSSYKTYDKFNYECNHYHKISIDKEMIPENYELLDIHIRNRVELLSKKDNKIKNEIYLVQKLISDNFEDKLNIKKIYMHKIVLKVKNENKEKPEYYKFNLFIEYEFYLDRIFITENRVRDFKKKIFFKERNKKNKENCVDDISLGLSYNNISINDLENPFKNKAYGESLMFHQDDNFGTGKTTTALAFLTDIGKKPIIISLAEDDVSNDFPYTMVKRLSELGLLKKYKYLTKRYFCFILLFTGIFSYLTSNQFTKIVVKGITYFTNFNKQEIFIAEVLLQLIVLLFLIVFFYKLISKKIIDFFIFNGNYNKFLNEDLIKEIIYVFNTNPNIIFLIEDIDRVCKEKSVLFFNTISQINRKLIRLGIKKEFAILSFDKKKMNHLFKNDDEYFNKIFSNKFLEKYDSKKSLKKYEEFIEKCFKLNNIQFKRKRFMKKYVFRNVKANIRNQINDHIKKD